MGLPHQSRGVEYRLRLDIHLRTISTALIESALSVAFIISPVFAIRGRHHEARIAVTFSISPHCDSRGRHPAAVILLITISPVVESRGRHPAAIIQLSIISPDKVCRGGGIFIILIRLRQAGVVEVWRILGGIYRGLLA
jgi:hypothetical protein